MANSCLMSQYFGISCATTSFCVAIHVWYMPWALAGMHLWLLLLIYCIDIHTYRSRVVSIVFTFMLKLVFLCLCSHHGCPVLTNPQYIAWGLACIVCIPCNSVCIELCIVGIVIMMLHHYPLEPPVVYGLWEHVLHMQSSSGGISPTHIESQVLLSILLYCHSALDRLLLAKVMGWGISLFSASSYPLFRLSLTCSNVGPQSTPDACFQVQCLSGIVFHACVFYHQWISSFIHLLVQSVPHASSADWRQPSEYWCTHL